MRDFQIRVSGDTIRFIYDDELSSFAELGQAETKRASHVEPVGSDWFVDLSPSKGPKLGPFKLKQEALDAEVAWLKEHKIPVPS